MTTIIGIDPGLKGAIAFLDGARDEVWIEPTPTLSAKEYDEGRMWGLIHERSSHWDIAYIEQVQAFPTQGRSSAVKSGIGQGLWRMVLTSMDIPYTIVSPRKWQRVMFAGIPKQYKPQRGVPLTKCRPILATKLMSIIAAKRLFPGVSLRRTDKCKKDDHNMADALLIAAYGRRQT